MINQVKSETLPEKIISTLAEKTGNDTSCVQLLVCRISPVIHGMQKTVDKSYHEARSIGVSAVSKIVDTMYTFLPNRTAFLNLGDECEKRFPDCQLLKFTDV